MRKGMLITVAGMALLAGTADVRAACIPTQDCASLGYKYTAAQCPDGAIACPFDTSKFFCMEPQTCDYTYTAESCAANCQNVGTSSCVRNGTTYYASCGSSKCSSGQTCNNGTCQSNSVSTGFNIQCCDDIGTFCDSRYYNNCKNKTPYDDCSKALSTQASMGFSSEFLRCYYSAYGGYVAEFYCE